jgi:hypothetical protein
MCIYIHIYIYIYIYIYTYYVYVHTYVFHACIHVYIYMCRVSKVLQLILLTTGLSISMQEILTASLPVLMREIRLGDSKDVAARPGVVPGPCYGRYVTARPGAVPGP